MPIVLKNGGYRYMFIPKTVIFEKDILANAEGNRLYKYFEEAGKEIIIVNSNRAKSSIQGDTIYERYRVGKNTLVIGSKKSLKFQTCKPSAHYQLPLVSGCIGQCEYCYLNTQLGDKPFIKIHLNIDEILQQAQKYIDERLPDITIFEGAATSDPVPVEPYSHALEKSITFFANQPNARFRFVTKYSDIDDLLGIEHNNHTEVRFSLNTKTVIDKYEHKTASANKRIEASSKISAAGYPMGFIIAPVFIYDGWKEEYRSLLTDLRGRMPSKLPHQPSFEVISHRFTTRAKNRILEIFPTTELDMDEQARQFKYGQFGYGKYMYPKDQLAEMKAFFKEQLSEIFSESEIKYII